MADLTQPPVEFADVCVVEEAFAFWHRRFLEPGEDLYVTGFAYAFTPSCDKPGPRYGCIDVFERAVGLFDTRQEAAAECKESLDIYVEDNYKFLGSETYDDYFHHLFSAEDEVLRVEADEVSVNSGTVSVIGGVVRGMVRNRSGSLYARHVVVAAPPEAGGGVWRWPLTLFPWESAPFEVGGWTGSSDPAVAAGALSVTASLSPYLDITRSFELKTSFYAHFPAFSLTAELVEPSSHPSLAEAVMGQTIDDLRAFAMFTDTKGDFPNKQTIVIDVVELTPTMNVLATEGPEVSTITVRTLPVPPELGTPTYLPNQVNIDIKYDESGNPPSEVWIGGANPPPAAPPVLQPTDPPLRVPRTPSPGE